MTTSKTIEELVEEIERMKGHINTLTFLFNVSIVQEGPEMVDLFLRNIENLELSEEAKNRDDTAINQAVESMQEIKKSIKELSSRSSKEELALLVGSNNHSFYRCFCRIIKICLPIEMPAKPSKKLWTDHKSLYILMRAKRRTASPKPHAFRQIEALKVQFGTTHKGVVSLHGHHLLSRNDVTT